MSNLRNRNPFSRNGNVNGTNQVRANGNYGSGRPTGYRDGYVHGRLSERRIEGEDLEVRDNDNAARGLLIGIALASLLGLGLGALYYWNQQQQESPLPVIVPVPSTSPAATQNQDGQTTVIERERTVDQAPDVIAVPQQPATVPQQSAPRINVTVPQQQAPAPTQDRTNVNVTVPNPGSAPAQQDTTVNVNPPQSTQTAPGTQTEGSTGNTDTGNLGGSSDTGSTTGSGQ